MPDEDVFLSYATQDQGRVLRLVRALEGTGWTVFWDRDIPSGKTWPEVLTEEITTCRSVVVVWSEKSLKSEWVPEEANEGKRRRILVPVRIDRVDPPLGYRQIQAADLIGWDGTPSAPPFRRLVKDLSLLLGRPPAEREQGEVARRAEEDRVRLAEEAARETQRSAERRQAEQTAGPAAAARMRRAEAATELRRAGPKPRARALAVLGLLAAAAVGGVLYRNRQAAQHAAFEAELYSAHGTAVADWPSGVECIAYDPTHVKILLWEGAWFVTVDGKALVFDLHQEGAEAQARIAAAHRRKCSVGPWGFWDQAVESNPTFPGEECFTFDPRGLEVREGGGNWLVTAPLPVPSGHSTPFPIRFSVEANARAAVEVLRRRTAWCALPYADFVVGVYDYWKAPAR